MLTPSDYQVEDSDAMLETEHALLWSDPGTGKTLIALEAFRKGEYTKGVVLAPKIALTMWAEQIEEQLGVPVVVLRKGTAAKKLLAGIHEHAVFIVTTFDLAFKWASLIRDFTNGMKLVNYDKFAEGKHRSALILDESHYVKSKDAKRTKALFGPSCIGRGGIVEYFDDVWLLSGTPIMSHPNDLWTQLRYVRDNILQHYGVLRYDDFVDTFCRTTMKQFHPRGPFHKLVTGSKNLDLLKQLIADCGVIRRKLEDVVDLLPKLTERPVEVSYGKVPNQKITMDATALVRELANPESPMSKVRRMLGIAKVTDIVDYLKTNEVKLPCLIGYWHTDVRESLVALIREAFPQARVEVVAGATSTADRDKIQTAFNAGEIDYLVGQMQVMRESWNLQEACSHVIIAEELVSPSMLDQFIARVYRRGQTRHVQVDHMRSEHSLDQALIRLRSEKAETNEELLG